MKKWIISGLGVVVGAIAGYAYWYYVGCYNGSCSITSSPVNSSLYGGLLGILLVNSFTPSRAKDFKNEDK